MLFNDTDVWIKKNGDPDFDVAIGSFDSTELRESVGFYIFIVLG